ncbi:hypothetical protein UFOVP830_49 [uncultured Caudovirales phage]|uniref:Uncharacterized protein n=1 Tax=uncultured Caudovirales phage TaxID=2100421 RepID=A0A6J5NZR0_9CAUD|nr:hypothetical protein UFOVP830_49 [uncultured Caudovirales phage]
MITHDYKPQTPRQRAHMPEILFFTASLIGFCAALVYAFYQL